MDFAQHVECWVIDFGLCLRGMALLTTVERLAKGMRIGLDCAIDRWTRGA